MLDNIARKIGSFGYNHRKLISIFAAVLLIAVIILESFSTISYHYAEENLVTEMFPTDDTIVIIYDNRDEEKLQEIIDTLNQDDKVLAVQAYGNTLGMPLSASEMANNFGIDESFVNALFVMYNNNMDEATITMKEFADFISSGTLSNNDMISGVMDSESLEQLNTFSDIIYALYNPEPMKSEDIADMLGVNKSIVKTVLFFSQLQTNSVRFADFVDMMAKATERLDFVIEDEQKAQMLMIKNIADLVRSNQSVTASELVAIMEPVAGNMLTTETMQLLMAMVKGNQEDMSDVRIPLYDIFCFLSETFIENENYAGFLDKEIKKQFKDAAIMIEDGKSQLMGTDHSRMIINTTYRAETKEMYQFHDTLNLLLDENLQHEFYVVGESALSYEVRETFNTEYTIISIVTAIAVLIVVCITFKSFFLPALLVAVIECSVFAMMSVMVIINHSMFFIALILVQCILMGSMIDYAILLTTYYIEVRKELPKSKALPEVMRRAMHAIMTSGSILVIVAFICGTFMTGQVASILITLGIGAVCALVLILFVLPALLSLFDKKVVEKWILPVPVSEAVEDLKEESDEKDDQQLKLFD